MASTVDVRVEALQRRRGARDLGGADGRRVVHDLALQVVEADAVVVDDADGADAGRGEIGEQRRAEAAGADDEHARGFQLLLALASDFLEDKVALVALDLLSREARWRFLLHGP